MATTNANAKIKDQLIIKKTNNKKYTKPDEKSVMYRADFTANLYVFLKFKA